MSGIKLDSGDNEPEEGKSRLVELSQVGIEETQIPQSTALAEAFSESIAELLSRDPQGYSKQDLLRVITVFRAQREKFLAVEAAMGSNKPKTSKGIDSRLKGLLVKVNSPEDLGL